MFLRCCRHSWRNCIQMQNTITDLFDAGDEMVNELWRPKFVQNYIQTNGA